jgi:uncharacterized membrane protein YhaH (DUF805 family)
MTAPKDFWYWVLAVIIGSLIITGVSFGIGMLFSSGDVKK